MGYSLSVILDVLTSMKKYYIAFISIIVVSVILFFLNTDKIDEVEVAKREKIYWHFMNKGCGVSMTSKRFYRDYPALKFLAKNFTSIKTNSFVGILSKGKKISSEDLKLLKENKDIIDLHLEGSVMGIEEIKVISTYEELYFLDLRETEITDEKLSYLLKLTKLKKLLLRDEDISKENLQKLKNGLPDCTIYVD